MKLQPLILAIFPLGTLLCLAQTPEKPASRLDELPQPWKEPIHRISFEEYDATLKYWAQQHPGLFTLEKRGEWHDGQPVYLVKITDSAVPYEDKQVALVSALHGGLERSGTTTILHLIEWLLGDSDLAKFITNLRLQRQRKAQLRLEAARGGDEPTEKQIAALHP